MDEQVEFTLSVRDSWLDPACRDLWAISAQLRAARGRARRSVVDVAANAYVRRQTLTDIELGRTWPDAETLSRVCAVLGLRLTATERSASVSSAL